MWIYCHVLTIFWYIFSIWGNNSDQLVKEGASINVKQFLTTVKYQQLTSSFNGINDKIINESVYAAFTISLFCAMAFIITLWDCLQPESVTVIMLLFIITQVVFVHSCNTVHCLYNLYHVKLCTQLSHLTTQDLCVCFKRSLTNICFLMLLIFFRLIISLYTDLMHY